MGRRNENANYYEFFKKREEERQQKGAEYQSNGSKNYAFVLSKGTNLGTLICRIIPDAFDNPYKSVYNVRELWAPRIDSETGELTEFNICHTIPEIDNWDDPKSISDNGKQIHQEIMDVLDEMNDYLERGVSFRKEIVYFYAKAMEFTKEGSDIPEKGFNSVKLYRSHSGSFSSAFTKAILSKKKGTGATSFLEKYISRNPDPTTKMISITTTNREAGFGFDTTIAFEAECAKSVALTEEDLKQCSDLSVNDVDLTTYDEEFWANELEALKLYLEQLKEEATDSYVEDEPEDEDEDAEGEVNYDDDSEESDEEPEESEDEEEDDDDDDHL